MLQCIYMLIKMFSLFISDINLIGPATSKALTNQQLAPKGFLHNEGNWTIWLVSLTPETWKSLGKLFKIASTNVGTQFPDIKCFYTWNQ